MCALVTVLPAFHGNVLERREGGVEQAIGVLGGGGWGIEEGRRMRRVS